MRQTFAAITLLLAACASSADGPVLAIRIGDGLRAQTAADLPSAMSLALAGLSANDRAELAEAIEGATDRAIARAHPLIVDLDDEPIGRELRRVLAARLPAVSAASNLVRTSWSSGGLEVELRDSCPPEAVHCMPLHAEPASALERRARFAAWAIANAAVVQTPRVDDAAARLRELASRPSSTIALVLTANLAADDELETSELRRAASRASELVDGDEATWLGALASGIAARLPIRLAADEILAVPRMGALARLLDFEDEVASAGPFDRRNR
jgi:hypothetical protein